MRALATLPKASLTIVGDGAEQVKYQQLATDLNIVDRVRFVGRKSMAQAVQMGRIMVLPSRNESFPYVVLETAAAGLPLIASDVGGIAEVVPPGMLFPAENIAELARLMSTAQSQKMRQIAVSKEFSAKIRQYCNAADMAFQITAFYNTLLSA